MRQRGDFERLYEPFGAAFYHREDPLWLCFKEGEKITRGLTIESAWSDAQRVGRL